MRSERISSEFPVEKEINVALPKLGQNGKSCENSGSFGASTLCALRRVRLNSSSSFLFSPSRLQFQLVPISLFRNLKSGGKCNIIYIKKVEEFLPKIFLKGGETKRMDV